VLPAHGFIVADEQHQRCSVIISVLFFLFVRAFFGKVGIFFVIAKGAEFPDFGEVFRRI
jgi:hypothetical protein